MRQGGGSMRQGGGSMRQGGGFIRQGGGSMRHIHGPVLCINCKYPGPPSTPHTPLPVSNSNSRSALASTL